VIIKVRNDGGPGGTGGRSHSDGVAPWNGLHPAGPAGAPAGGGQGIIGMRERTAMLGGHLEAAPSDDGGFLVTAVLPDIKDPGEGPP
jgi:hypothetical protein